MFTYTGPNLPASSRLDIGGANLAFPFAAGGERLVWQTADGRETALVDVEPSTSLALSTDGRRVLTTDRQTLLLTIRRAEAWRDSGRPGATGSRRRTAGGSHM
jgi:hypothetical protein